MLNLILSICDRDFDFEDYERCREYFKQVINALRQMNYSEFHSPEFEDYQQKLNNLLAEKQIKG